MDGDKPVIDFEAKVRKKTQYANFEEGTQEIDGAFSFAKEIGEFEKKATEKIEALTTEKETAETNFTSVKADYDEIKPKYDQFVKNAEEKAKEETEQKKNECFAKFDEHLSDVADYTALKEDKANLTLDAIEAKCAILYTQKSLTTNFTKKQKNDDTLTADIIDFSSDDEGFVETKYGKIRVSK
jgi:F0F1-type ATP synthase membrane subunit b/b'